MTLLCLNAHIVASRLELTNDTVRLIIYRAANLLVHKTSQITWDCDFTFVQTTHP